MGVERKPTSVEELVTAIKHIGECLLCLHERGYVHCDVRWNNIVEVFGEWVLIDSEYACKLDGEPDLLAARSKLIKPRYVLDTADPWSPAFDLYQVGMLLAESDVAYYFHTGLVELRDLLLSKSFSVDAIKRCINNM